MNEQRFESGPAILNWKVAGIVAIFAAGLVIAGVLRFYDVHAEDPPALAAYATALYISLTIFAAVLSTRVGVPLKRLGFGAGFGTVLRHSGVASCIDSTPCAQLDGSRLWRGAGISDCADARNCIRAW